MKWKADLKNDKPPNKDDITNRGTKAGVAEPHSWMKIDMGMRGKARSLRDQWRQWVEKYKAESEWTVVKWAVG